MKKNKKLSLIFESPISGNFFFGYYGISPLNKNNEKHLAQRANFVDRNPVAGDKLEVGYFDFKNPKSFNLLTTTSTWNWQQGCMLQWLPSNDGDKIILNDLINGRFVSKTYNVMNGEQDVLPMAIYTVSHDGLFALCIDNERHYWCRPGYNYQGIVNAKKKVPFDPLDGIWKMNIPNGQLTKIIEMSQLIKLKPLSTMRDAFHYVEHITISPNDEKIAFFHRWLMSNGQIHTRFIVADKDGENISIVNDTGRVSHYCWKGNEAILAWGALNNPFNSLRKNIFFSTYMSHFMMATYRFFIKSNSIDGSSKASRFMTGDGYIIINLKNRKSSRVVSDKLDRDGHPTFCPTNENLFITDTYPDINNDYRSNLYIHDFTSNQTELLESIPMDMRFFGLSTRADLHPKWSNDSSFMSVDILIDGKRSIRTYAIE